MSLPLYYFLTVTAINILMSWALYLPYRVAHLHFLTVANMAISGYLGGWLVQGLGFSFWAALPIGLAAGRPDRLAALAVHRGRPDLRRGHRGLHLHLHHAARSSRTPRRSARPWGMFGLPLVAGSPDAHRWALLALLYALVLVVGFLIHRFDHSRLGRAASAVFVDKDLATSFGVDIKKLGRLLQVFSSTVAGGCGVIYGFLYRSFHLDFFTFHLVGLFMTIIFVGGYATMWGTVVAAPVLYGLTLLFPPAVASWRIVIYGAILVAVLVLKPEGFITRRLVLNIERLLSSKRKKI